MKTKFMSLTLLALIIVFNCAATNLVINGSFENGTPPNAGLGIFGSSCTSWQSASDATPDYFMTASTHADSWVPNNCFGTNVYPLEGNAYAGLITYATTNYAPCLPNYIYREYIEGGLSSTLTNGVTYKVSFWVQNANKNCQNADDDYFTSIGVYFSPTSVNQTLTVGCDIPNLTGIAATWETPTYVQSVGVWSLITFNHVANGTENYILIGNFHNNATSTVSPTPTNRAARGYYYIDAVSVEPPECRNCICGKDVSLDHFVVEADGNASVNVSVSPSLNPLVKFRVTLVNYRPNVDKECLKCDTYNEHMFGDIVDAPSLYGALPEFTSYNPNVSVNFSREVTWCYDHAVQFHDPTTFTLELKFPPILNLSCCKNDDNFCLRIESWVEGCRACDILVCKADTILHGRNAHFPPNPKNPEPKSEGSLMKIIPNPTSNNFKVVIPKENSHGTLEILNLNGGLMQEFQMNAEEYTVNTKTFSEGTYIVRFKNSNVSFEEKVVIKK